MTAARGAVYVTDFAAIIEGLRRQGFRLQAIADHTGISRPSLIRYMLEGSSPSHDKGERLIEFYCGVYNCTREQVPKELRTQSAREAIGS